MTVSERQAALANPFPSLDRPYVAWATVATASAIAFLQPVSPQSASLSFMADFTRTQPALRCAVPSYFLGDTPMQIPAGFLVDRCRASPTSVSRSGHEVTCNKILVLTHDSA
jgi:hypothetical protein